MHKPDPKPPIRPVLAKAPAPPASPQAISLLPGQWHFGSQGLLKTLLGSCVAITLWHPQRGLGGMCHFLLPQRQRQPGVALDGRFGDEAVELMVQSLRRHGTKPQEYQAHLYGGADTLPDAMNVKFNVGERNIARGWELIEQYGFQLQDVDVGDTVPRTVSLWLPGGQLTVVRGKSASGGIGLP